MATSMQARSSLRGSGRARDDRSRTSSMRRRSRRPTDRSSSERRVFRDRDGRSYRRVYLDEGTRSRPRRRSARAPRSDRRMPRRDANGRFIKRRVRAAPRRRVARRRPRQAPERRARRIPTTSVVREASRRSVAGPALVKRRWWRIDGPVDSSLPDGYAYER